MDLFLVQVYPETIKIMGRWYSNAFLVYIRLQSSDPSKSISDIMISTKLFYTTPETEIIHHNLGQE